MRNSSSTSGFSPKVGVFWFVAPNGSASRLISVLSPFDINAVGLDFAKAPHDHEASWPEVRDSSPELAGYDFDYFPRGRLDYFAPGRRWIFSVDPKLKRNTFIACLVSNWCLPPGHVTVKGEDAYASRASVGEPYVDAGDMQTLRGYFSAWGN